MLPDDIQPSRPWDELIAVSTRRGRQIRRRRQAMWASGPLGVIVIGAAVLLSGGAGGADSLRVVPPAAPEKAPAPLTAPIVKTTQPAAVGNDPTTAHANAVAADPGSRMAGATGPKPIRSHGLAAAVRSGAPVAVTHLPTVTFTDAAGDGTPRSAPVGTTNDPAYDILRMTYTATRAGLQIDMWLAGNNSGDGFYRATLTDPSSGCTLSVVLGGSWDDDYTDSCSNQPTVLPDVVDPSADHLRAVIPFGLFPSDVEPSHRLSGLGGTTESMSSVGTATLYDTASSPQQIRPTR